MAKLFSSVFGKAAFTLPTGEKAPYSTLFGVGQLLIGWKLMLPDWQRRDLEQAWPFVYKEANTLYLPIPGTFQEWITLQRIVKNIQGLELPPSQIELGTRSVENAELRRSLSHAPKMGTPVTIDGLQTPEGFEGPMFPFQEVAVRYVQSLGYRALVGDDMGLGKTIVGIASALSYGSQKTIIVTRSVALGAWTRAIKKWTTQCTVLAVGKSPLKSTRKDGSIKKTAGEIVLNDDIDPLYQGFIVLNYEILQAWKEKLLQWNPQFIVFDEVHAVKEPKAARSVAAYQLMADIPGVVGLTGTPINNRPLELYQIVHNIQPGKWGGFFAFAQRYCDAHLKVIRRDWKQATVVVENGVKRKVPKEIKAWDFSGARREKELYYRLRSNIMVRRLKDEVLSLLPPIEETIPIEPSKQYRQVEAGELIYLDGMLSENPSIKRKAEASLHALFAAAAMDKIAWVKEWLEAFLEDTDQKIVIFFHYQRVGEALTEFLKKLNIQHINLWGTTPDKNGDVEFQTNKDCRVALCSYSTAREAVTLTEAAYQMYAEYPWVPGWAEQARDRTRRIGQLRAVTYYYPILVNSVEERLVSGMLKKQKIISLITQGVHKNAIGLDTSVLSSTYEM